MKRPSRADGILLGLLLALSLGSCTEPARPIIEPFLVGRWEAALELAEKRWIERSQIVVLVLYDDGTAALDNRKGTWVLGDLSRASVRVEIPQRYEARTYELLLKNEEKSPLWGTMVYEGKVLRFEQKENGGIVGTAGLFREDVEDARVARERAERESAQTALHKAGWKRRLAIAWHCLWYGPSYGVSCS